MLVVHTVLMFCYNVSSTCIVLLVLLLVLVTLCVVLWNIIIIFIDGFISADKTNLKKKLKCNLYRPMHRSSHCIHISYYMDLSFLGFTTIIIDQSINQYSTRWRVCCSSVIGYALRFTHLSSISITIISNYVTTSTVVAGKTKRLSQSDRTFVSMCKSIVWSIPSVQRN